MEEAVAQANKALALSDHGDPDLGILGGDVNLRAMSILSEGGSLARVAQLRTQMLAFADAHIAPGAVDWAYYLGQAATVDLALHRTSQAKEELERALRIAEKHKLIPGYLATLNYHLAQAVMASHGDSAQAAALSQQAAEDLKQWPAKHLLREKILAWQDRTFGGFDAALEVSAGPGRLPRRQRPIGTARAGGPRRSAALRARARTGHSPRLVPHSWSGHTATVSSISPPSLRCTAIGVSSKSPKVQKLTSCLGCRHLRVCRGRRV